MEETQEIVSLRKVSLDSITEKLEEDSKRYVVSVIFDFFCYYRW